MSKNRNIKKIFVHCTDSQDSLDIGFREINEWHKKKGWLSKSGISCGYHYIIRRDGRVERGRNDWENGAHVKGHNKTSIGVVWVGRNDMSQAQYDVLLPLLRGLMNQYNVDIENVLGHGEVDHFKTCPNLNMLKLRGNLLFTSADKITDQLKEIMKL